MFFGEFLSNSAWLAWCASAGMATAMMAAAMTVTNDLRIEQPPMTIPQPRSRLTIGRGFMMHGGSSLYGPFVVLS